MIRLLLTLGFTTLLCTVSTAKEIKHRFIAVDESGSQLHYVDQFKPSRSWSKKVPGNSRDVQMIGNGKFLLSNPKGYYEVSIKDGTFTKEVKSFKNVYSARRTPDGKTYLGRNHKGITITILDKKDQVIKEVSVPGASGLRLMRLTHKKTILLGANKHVVEIDLDGNIVRKLSFPGGKHIYKAVYLPNGQLVAAAGYGGFIAFIDKNDKVIKKIGEDAKKSGETIAFFSDFQILKNGNIIVANWHGHGRNDSRKGAHLLEFDKNGKFLWKWHDPELSGCLHGMMIVDRMNPKYMYTDIKGIPSPAKTKASR